METHSNPQALIKELLVRLGARRVEVERIAGRVHPIYHVTTDDAAMLIGSGGENLKALTHIVKKMVEQKLGREASMFLLDINGYQRKKIETIEQQARLLAERARMFKTSVEMSPMNAYERMVVHSLFAEDPDIQTQSVGEGKHRHVVFVWRSREKAFDPIEHV